MTDDPNPPTHLGPKTGQWNPTCNGSASDYDKGSLRAADAILAALAEPLGSTEGGE